MKVNPKATLKLAAAVFMVSTCLAGDWQKLVVKVIDRQYSQTQYSYLAPGHFRSDSASNISCAGGDVITNCGGFATTSGSYSPAHEISYSVRGATLALQLPDGRIAVVNCESKYSLKFDFINRRDCRVPVEDTIWADFKGNRATLRWPESIDSSKFAQETYSIVAVLNR